MNHIIILSDGSGRTARQALRASLTQFPDIEVDLDVFAKIRSEEQVDDILEFAAAKKALIVHTLVSTRLREYILKASRYNNVETIDIMGPFLAQLSMHFSDKPSEKPGLFHELNKAYFQRIEAMEYAFRHDDGQHVEELHKAEIVLIGVSRTFKTPVSIYLAFKGWYVANIPIILGIDPPEILFSLIPERVFCLTTTTSRLAALRRVRDDYLGGGTGNYASADYVEKELSYARKIFNINPLWQVINVTNRPIEEIASKILSFMKQGQHD